MDLEGIKSSLGFLVEDRVQASSNRGRVAGLCFHLKNRSAHGLCSRGWRRRGDLRFVDDVVRLDGDFRRQQVRAEKYLVSRAGGRSGQPHQLVHLAAKLLGVERLEDVLVGTQLERLVLLELGGCFL